MHALRAIVLPTAFVGDLVVIGFAGDDIVHSAPLGGMEGVDESTGGIAPSGRTLRTDRILCPAVEVAHVGIEVGIPRQRLTLAIHEKLI